MLVAVADFEVDPVVVALLETVEVAVDVALLDAVLETVLVALLVAVDDAVSDTVVEADELAELVGVLLAEPETVVVPVVLPVADAVDDALLVAVDDAVDVAVDDAVPDTVLDAVVEAVCDTVDVAVEVTVPETVLDPVELTELVAVEVAVVLGVESPQSLKTPYIESCTAPSSSTIASQPGWNFRYPSIVQLATPELAAGNAYLSSRSFKIGTPCRHELRSSDASTSRESIVLHLYSTAATPVAEAHFASKLLSCRTCKAHPLPSSTAT